MTCIVQGHRRFVGWLILLMAAAGAGCQNRGDAVARSTAHFPAGTGFTRHTVTVDGEPRSVWVFVPKDYRAEQSYPAVVFLHGLFEAWGSSQTRCISAGLGPVIARAPDDWPFITIFPQSSGTWRGPTRERIVLESLDWAHEKWSIDRDRVILAGLSYGGLGTWEIGGRHCERFAALVPVSAHRATELADALARVPVWAFAYRGDPVVDSDSAEDMRDAIVARGGDARLTEFEGVGHDCWDRAVAESDLVQWMLSQRRGHGSSASVAQVE